MNFLIFGLGTTAPHALSCPPPEPPRLVAKRLTILPKCTLQFLEPLTETA